MSIPRAIKDHLASVAENALETFRDVYDVANAQLSVRPTSPEDVLANLNTLTSRSAIEVLSKVHEENRRALRQLLHEPAIARVVAINDEKVPQIYFICRSSPVQISSSQSRLASRNAPVGRLASLPVGDGVLLPNGEWLEVVEKATLSPFRNEQGWDSINSILEGDTFGPLTVESLRALRASTLLDETDGQLLDQLLEEEVQSSNVFRGIRRAVLTRMELRDQPVLDKFQDEIFRLSLGSRLLLLGPPGTGKTTTLIRRLGQKLDLEFLDEDERSLVENLDPTIAMPHADSWLMFTPTTLLQQYLKESFSREGVPASDRHVRTWTDYQREFARNIIGLLRTPKKRSGFVLQHNVDYLADDIYCDLTSWFDHFNDWQQATFLGRLRSAAHELSTMEEGRLARLGGSLLAVLEPNDPVDIVRVLRGLRAEFKEARAVAAELQADIDDAIRRALILQVNRDQRFLDDLAAFLDSVRESANRSVDEGEVGEDEQEDEDEDDEEGPPRTGRRGAEIAFRRALRTQARALANARPLRKGATTTKIIDWLGNRGLNADDQMRVGHKLLRRARVRLFVNPVKSYIDGIAARYRVYRQSHRSEERWYKIGTIRRTEIHPLELDLLLLSILRFASSLLAFSDVRRDLEDTYWAALQPVHNSYRNQIFADEATDFSPVQLACMSALSHPATRSFFACGDFNQRLSVYGARTAAAIQWAVPGIEIERIIIGYRQSRELNEFARQIVRIRGGDDYDVVLPEHVDRDGMSPVLAENMRSNEAVGIWLAERVTEIETFVSQLPTVSVLVPEEDQVIPLARALGEALAIQNVNVVPCSNGQVIGQDNDIRVFDVQHIKGLEFEAVFFKDVDRLAVIFPDLFDKFLYVGATRAATYLGLTCSGQLPDPLSNLRPIFSARWND